MLQDLPITRLVSFIFGGLTSLILSCFAFLLLTVSLSSEPVAPFLTLPALLGFYGTAAIWAAITDAYTSKRWGRLAVILGLISGISAIVLIYAQLWFVIIPLYPIALCTFGSTTVGIYLLVRLIQYEVRSRPPQT